MINLDSLFAWHVPRVREGHKVTDYFVWCQDKYSVAPKPVVNGHGSMGMTGEEHFKATLDQALLQLQAEVSNLTVLVLAIPSPERRVGLMTSFFTKPYKKCL